MPLLKNSCVEIGFTFFCGRGITGYDGYDFSVRGKTPGNAAQRGR
jgi:hypothetical protein